MGTLNGSANTGFFINFSIRMGHVEKISKVYKKPAQTDAGMRRCSCGSEQCVPTVWHVARLEVFGIRSNNSRPLSPFPIR